MQKAPDLLAPAVSMIASLDWMKEQERKQKRACTAGRRYQIDLIHTCLTTGGFGTTFGRRAATYLHGETGTTTTEDDAPEDSAFDQAAFFNQSPAFDHEMMGVIPEASPLCVFVNSLLVSGKDVCVCMGLGAALSCRRKAHVDKLSRLVSVCVNGPFGVGFRSPQATPPP